MKSKRDTARLAICRAVFVSAALAVLAACGHDGTDDEARLSRLRAYPGSMVPVLGVRG